MRTGFVGIFLCLASAIAASAEEPTLSLEANRRELYLGESFILRVTVSGPDCDVEPDLSGIKNCSIEFLGARDMSKYSMTIVNGRMVRQGSSSRVLSYRVTPLSAGVIQAGPVSLTMNGKTVSAQGPMVSVNDIDKQDIVKISISSSRETVLVGESFDITLAILIRALEDKYASVHPLFPDNPPNVDIPYLSEIPGLQGPDINKILNEHSVARWDQAGIGINNITYRIDPFDFGSLSSLRGFFDEPRRAKFSLNPSMIEQNGRSYIKYTLTLTFTPIEEGDYVFGPAIFKGLIPAEVDALGRAKGVDVFAVGHACTVRVIPPPEEGRPLSFSGAVGQGLTARASLDTQECNVGDPLKLTLTISGNVRFDKMMPPRLALQKEITDLFTVYDSTVETKREQNQVRYIYTLRPLAHGARQLPQIEVSYYDTDDRAYKTVLTEPVPIQIHKTSEVTASRIIGQLDKRNGKDDKPMLVPAPIRTDASGAVPESLIGNHLVVGLLTAAGPVFYAFALLGRFVAANKKGWQKRSRRRKATGRALSGLGRAHAPAADLDTARGRGEIRAILQRYLADKLQQPSAALTPNDIQARLIQSGISRENAEEFSSLFEQLFNAGFRSAHQKGETEAVLKKIEDLLPRLDKEWAGKQSVSEQTGEEDEAAKKSVTR